MVSFRQPVIEWIKRRFGSDTLEKMEKVAEQQEEKVFGTQYTVDDYENDLTHHEEQMVKAEQKFEHYNDLRKESLEDAHNSTGLTRKRFLAEARKMRKKAFRHVKMFAAHLEKFERKLDELTAHRTKAVSADKNATVDLDETAEQISEELVGETPDRDSMKRREADKAIDRELNEHSLDDKVEHEEEALRKMEEEGVSADEVSLEDDVDSFIDDELGSEMTNKDQNDEEDEEDQVVLDW